MVSHFAVIVMLNLHALHHGNIVAVLWSFALVPSGCLNLIKKYVESFVFSLKVFDFSRNRIFLKISTRFYFHLLSLLSPH